MREITAERKKYLTWVVSETRRKLKVRAIEYKGGCCTRCGYSKCVAALQFHHLDPKKKDFRISQRVMSWDNIRRELDKTILICANCHLELHHEESERSRIQQEAEVRANTPVRVLAPHGASRYSMGCRCVICKAGHATRLREYKASKRAQRMVTKLSGRARDC